MASRRFLVVVSGAKIFAAANPLRSDRRNRTKDSIATVRHLNLDFGIDGEARLTSVRTSRCWWSAAAPRLPLRGVSVKAQARMRWSRLRRSLQLGWSPRLLCGC